MKPKVLIIEDNEQNIYMMTYLLEHGGFEVMQARDGKRGLELATTNGPPDLIILDIQLPEMDGYAVAGKLRGIAGLEQVPIVAATSYAMVGDRERILSAGCTAYIEKPLDPDTFVRFIRAQLPPGFMDLEEE
jgi:CheY-like chemotaxis protein